MYKHTLHLHVLTVRTSSHDTMFLPPLSSFLPSLLPPSPTILTPRLLLISPPTRKLLLQRILLITSRIHQLFQTMFAGRDTSHGVMLDGFACLPEQFVGGVFFVSVEVYDFGEVGWCLGEVELVIGFMVPAEELAFG